MLAVNLRKNPSSPGLDSQLNPMPSSINQLPGRLKTRSQIESQGDRRTGRGLNVFPKVETVLRIEAPLISAARVLVQDVREAECVKHTSGREPNEHLSVGRHSNDALDYDRRIHAAFRCPFCSQ
jgi:hypothetical protein